ncbi:unnamed protein product, partial [Chrysoparadoxa australica]
QPPGPGRNGRVRMRLPFILLACSSCSSLAFTSYPTLHPSFHDAGSEVRVWAGGFGAPKQSSGAGGSRGGKRKGRKGKEEQPVTTALTPAAPAPGNEEDDYALLPPLPPRILETLQGVEEPGGAELTNEAVDKLRLLHGFANFPEAAEANAAFPGVRVLHWEPLVIGVEDFFTNEECDAFIAMSVEEPSESSALAPHKQRSATLGTDAEARAQRTSTTWFHHFHRVPQLIAKASSLLGLDPASEQWEEVQTVRYRTNERFTWHIDALPPASDLAAKGGQRIATLLVYLTTLQDNGGGATLFRDLGPLRVQPKKGSALLFFPSAGGIDGCPLDMRTVHSGEVVKSCEGQGDKWIAQQTWLRESSYKPLVPKGNRHRG